MNQAMHQYDFTLTFAGPLELTPDLADVLFAAGYDDGTPGTADGVLFVDFHREASTFEDAIRSAVADVSERLAIGSRVFN